MWFGKLKNVSLKSWGISFKIYVMRFRLHEYKQLILNVMTVATVFILCAALIATWSSKNLFSCLLWGSLQK